MPPFLRRLGGAFDNAPLLLTLTMLFWAGNMTVGRAVSGMIPPVALSFWRWGIALTIALILGWRAVRADWPVIRRNWFILVLLGVLGIGCYNTMFYAGLNTAPVTHGVLINANAPLMILLMGGVIFGDRTPALAWLGVVLAMAGVTLVAVGGARLSFGVGEIWMGAGMACYALYTVYLRKRPTMRPISFIIVTFSVGVVMLAPLYAIEMRETGPLTLSPEVVAAFAYVGVFPSLAAYLCFNRGVELAGSARASAYFYLIPVFGTTLAMIFLGERLEARHIGGFALVFTGLLLAERARRASPRPLGQKP